MGSSHLNNDWLGKVSNTMQIGGIETAVLDNGAGRGVRIAWVNTGGGLRYKVVLDRAMDIADAFGGSYSLTWLSSLGITSPEKFSNKGIDWLDTFGGGLLATCGLLSTGPPGKEQDWEYGLHGKIGNIPAEIESVIQPDPMNGKLTMSITGIMKETKIFGPNLELRRTISSELGRNVIKIDDQVSNKGNTPTPHMYLYHCNLGWPLVDEGTEINWEGVWKARDKESEEIFGANNNFHVCPKIMETHNGGGEAAAFIDVASDENGISACSIINRKIGLQLNLKFKKEQLPWLINWQHWGKGEYVTGIEPATCPPIGLAQAIKEGKAIFLKPGEKRDYQLEFELRAF